MDNLIENGFVKLVLEKLCEPLMRKTIDFTKEQWERFKIDFGIAFESYLNNSYNKYSKIKTILYRTEPQYIYNFYEVPNLRKPNGEIFKVDDIDNIINISNFIIIEGTGGIGKSMLMKHLFLSVLKKKKFIPIFFELKDLNILKNDYEMMDLILKKLDALGSSINKKCLDYALCSGSFIFLLDGYDEVLNSSKDSFLNKLELFCDKYSKNHYIISSRPYSEFIEFQRFSVLSTCRLEKEQAVSLIRKTDFDTDIKERFIIDLNNKLYNKHFSFASNPLLLNIMLLTYDNYAEIPEKLHLFYSNAFETLYSKHDATKAGFRREMRSNLSYDLFKKIFSYFCFISYNKGKIEFSKDDLISILKSIKNSNIEFDIENYINDLINSVCVLYKDGLNYKFSHRSFQEYFSALFLKELPDENMKKICNQLIYKEGKSIAQDSVFDMLYDMSEERFEENVLLPVLINFEKDYKDYDENEKYNLYFDLVVNRIRFQNDINAGKEECNLWLGTQFYERNDLRIIYKFSFKYAVKKKREKNELKIVNDNLLEYLINKKDYKVNTYITKEEIKNDLKTYSLLKETWIGESIKIMANLSNKLKNKQKDIEENLIKLLS